MKDILKEITRLRLQRNWSEYDLAKHADIAQSTISSWYRRNQTPTFQNLDRVCHDFGITLSQFFAEGDDPISLSRDQIEMLDHWSALNPKQQEIILALLKNM